MTNDKRRIGWWIVACLVCMALAVTGMAMFSNPWLVAGSAMAYGVTTFISLIRIADYLATQEYPQR